MAIRYVRAPGAGSSTGTGWSTAAANLGRYIAASSGTSVAGDTVYVAHDHLFSYGSTVTLNFSTGSALPTNIIVVNDSTLSSSYTINHVPLASSIVTTFTAMEQITTGATTWNIQGNVNIHGMTFQNTTGSGSPIQLISSGTADCIQQYTLCKFVPGGTSARTLAMGTGGAGASQAVTFNRCDCALANNTGALINVGAANFLWNGGAIYGSGTTQPTVIFNPTQQLVHMEVRDVTMSSLTGTVMSLSGAGGGKSSFMKCQLSTTSAFAISGTSDVGSEVVFLGCGPTTTSSTYEFLHYNAFASADSDTSVYRVGGASDGTTNFSIKVVALVGRNIDYTRNLRFKIADLWWDSTKTKIRVYIAQRTGITRVKDNQFWIEAEFVLSGTAWGTILTNKATDYNVLDAGTDWTTDSTSDWTGLAGEVMSYGEITPTGDQSGPMSVWGVLAFDNSAANNEIWVDPLVELIP